MDHPNQVWVQSSGLECISWNPKDITATLLDESNCPKIRQALQRVFRSSFRYGTFYVFLLLFFILGPVIQRVALSPGRYPSNSTNQCEQTSWSAGVREKPAIGEESERERERETERGRRDAYELAAAQATPNDWQRPPLPDGAVAACSNVWGPLSRFSMECFDEVQLPLWYQLYSIHCISAFPDILGFNDTNIYAHSYL